MDVYGSLKELVSLILRKSGFQVTIAAPATVSKAYEYKLPNTDSNSSAVLVTDTHTQTLTNKTLTAPAISDFTSAGHDHSEASKGGQLSNSAIAAAAAIDRSKLANGTINHVVINSSGSGALSSEAQLARSRGGFGMDISSLTPSFSGANIISVDSAAADTATEKSIGKLYKTIQEAISAAVAAGASHTNKFLIKVAPGTYTENITLYNGIIVAADSPSTVTVVGKISSNAGLSNATAVAGLANLDFVHSPTSPGVSFNLVGAISTHLCNFGCYPAADVAVTAIHCAPAISQTMIHGLMGVTFIPQVAYTSDADVLDANGEGLLSIYTSSVLAQSNQSAGNICLVNESGTGVRNYNSIFSYGIMTNAAYSGSVRGFCTESASTGSRLAQACQVRLEGAGSGTAIAFNLDTGTDPSEYDYTGCTVIVEGFTNEYITYTSVNAVQKVWLISVNKNLTKSGTGRSIVTPYDDAKSGFVEYAGNPADGSTTFYSWASPNFTISLAGAGVVRGAPIAWDAGQSVALTDLATNFVYMDSDGLIGVTTTANESLYLNNIVLFAVWRDGSTITVAKENHPYKFDSAVSGAWHRLFGVLLEGTGANIAQLGLATALQLQVTGTDVLTDHGLDTTIPANAGPLSVIYAEYLNGSSGGAAKYHNTLTTIPDRVWRSGSYQTVQNNYFVVHRLYVTKNSMNSAAPQYISVVPVTEYPTLAQADAAIASGAVQALPAELKALESAQLGYVVLKKQGGTLQIEEIIVEKQTFSARFLGSSPATAAGLITTVTSGFNVILSGADASVQAALDTIDNTAAKKAASSTDNAVARFDQTTGQLLQNSVVIIDDSGNTSGVGTLNNHAIPVGTDPFTTNDATQTLTNKTLTTPTIGNFTNSNHDHSDDSKGGLVVAASPTQRGAVTTGAQSFAGAKTFNDGIAADTIAEKTAAAGVTIDSALVKDGTFRASSTDANLLPVGTTAQRSSAAAGNIRHNSDIGTVEFHDGTNWVPAAKVKTVSLINGSADLYTPETGVLAYEALVYSSVSATTSLTNILVVNDSGTWTYSASEAGDTVVAITVDASTGKLSLAATGSGTCKSRISVIM
jgi:hypothetical protein